MYKWVMYKLVESCSTTKRNEIPAILAILAEWTFLLKCSVKAANVVCNMGGSCCFCLINPAIFECSNMFWFSPRKLRKDKPMVDVQRSENFAKNSPPPSACWGVSVLTCLVNFNLASLNFVWHCFWCFTSVPFKFFSNSKRDVVTFPLCWLRWQGKNCENSVLNVLLKKVPLLQKLVLWCRGLV